MHASAQILAPASLPIPTRAIGFPAADATTIIDHGGSPEAAAPRQLNCGMALFTLLDGGLPPSGAGHEGAPSWP
jgi:Family of unknown function (DUF6081)